MFAERFKNRLLIQRQAGLYRHPPTITQRKGKHVFAGNRKVLNFASNDYLGLATSEELKQKVSKNFQKYGTSSLDISAMKKRFFFPVAIRQTSLSSPLYSNSVTPCLLTNMCMPAV
jgi:hypothetical protein